MSDLPYALAIHGGAGPRPGRDFARVEVHLTKLLKTGEAMLREGEAALDVIECVVREMELSGLYLAGKGSPDNRAGYVELDAAIMDGTTRNAGAVALVRDIVHPVTLARRVMTETCHVLIAGAGAVNFAQAQELDFVPNPEGYYVLPVGVIPDDLTEDDLSHGTVGAVARDNAGQLAAATSTGGVFGKQEGRVGDTPLIGAGTWADNHVAVSCTGLGEYFIRAGGAYSISARMQFKTCSLQQAVDEFIADMGGLGGNGGVIAVSASGEVASAFNSSGLKRALVGPGHEARVAIFD
jgi:isoaspartyl peptidase/L-asparaginase-like protein (Ntn-hydrolase superfamily)